MTDIKDPHIVAVGDPLSGLRFFGPTREHDDDCLVRTRRLEEHGTAYCVAPLQPIEDMADVSDVLDMPTYTHQITERYVVVEGITSAEQSEALRQACGLPPRDWGRWKGNEHIAVEDASADLAIEWAREHRHPYQVSVTRRYAPSTST